MAYNNLIIPTASDTVPLQAYVYQVPGATQGINYPQTATSIGSNRITLTSHGLNDGDIIVISNASTSGLTVNTPYYVVNSTTNNFQLATSKGGSAISLTSGTPTWYVSQVYVLTNIVGIVIATNDDPASSKSVSVIPVGQDNAIVFTLAPLTTFQIPVNVKQVTSAGTDAIPIYVAY
jgi:hypothetical protein